jgi:hypothetical protein
MIGFTKQHGKNQYGKVNHYSAHRGLCTSKLNINIFIYRRTHTQMEGRGRTQHGGG